MDSEELYCHEISRRSVARAALHLGIDGMSQDSLDVLADVLQHYLERIGKTMAHLVEASGRPSSHVNALDALQAIHMTTAPAAHQVNETTTVNRSQRSAPWQDLAVFLFGPKWEGPKEVGAGGKVGPSAPAVGGWRAPYLEEVPPFPAASDKVANPHRLKADVGLSLHENVSALGEKEVNEEDLKDIPDKVFTEWGAVVEAVAQKNGKKDDETNKEETKPAATDDDEKKEENEDEPPTKKQKLGEEEPPPKRPPYVASFMPSFPQSLQSGRSFIDVPTATAATAPENLVCVRSSLVDLGQKAQYWGSGWDGAPQVPVGLTQADQQASVVVPLGRASNSRVSRILEGSMDAAH